MLILVNPTANAGKAAGRWRSVESELRRRDVPFEARLTVSSEDAGSHVAHAVRRGERVFIAAGGDGTVHSLLNVLMSPPFEDVRDQLHLGAIGLGSSNDFHKPFSEERMLEGRPIRIDVARSLRCDVGRAVLEDREGQRHVKHFLLNASMGLVAEGNAFFNTRERILTWLKRTNVELAILYAAVVNLFRFQPLQTMLRLDGGSELALEVSTVGVLKRIHFAGGMRYDTEVAWDDGQFDVNVWERMDRATLVRTLANLYRGRFRGLPRTRCLRARNLEVSVQKPMALECDGEVTEVVRAEFEVVPKSLYVCG